MGWTEGNSSRHKMASRSQCFPPDDVSSSPFRPFSNIGAFINHCFFIHFSRRQLLILQLCLYEIECVELKVSCRDGLFPLWNIWRDAAVFHLETKEMTLTDLWIIRFQVNSKSTKAQYETFNSRIVLNVQLICVKTCTNLFAEKFPYFKPLL